MAKTTLILIFISLAAALVGIAPSLQAAEEVTVYSSNMQALNDLAAAEFEKASGVKVNMVRAPSGVALKRMRSGEGQPPGRHLLGRQQGRPHIQPGPPRTLQIRALRSGTGRIPGPGAPLDRHQPADPRSHVQQGPGERRGIPQEVDRTFGAEMEE